MVRPAQPARLVPERVRRIAGSIACWLWAGALLLWLTTFLPFDETPEVGGFAILPFAAFGMMFPLWWITIFEGARENAVLGRRRSGQGIPLRGRRAAAAAALWLIPLSTFASLAFVTWSTDDVGAFRFGLSIYLVFTGTAALFLTQPDVTPAAPSSAGPPPEPATAGSGGWTRSIVGDGEVFGSARGAAEDVVTRLGKIVPLCLSGDPSAGRIHVTAEWELDDWSVSGLPLRVGGTVSQGESGWSTVALTVQVASVRARRRILAAPVLGMALAVGCLILLAGVGVGNVVGLFFGMFLGLAGLAQLAAAARSHLLVSRVRRRLLSELDAPNGRSHSKST